jgi:hypothetical protein
MLPARSMQVRSCDAADRDIDRCPADHRRRLRRPDPAVRRDTVEDPNQPSCGRTVVRKDHDRPGDRQDFGARFQRSDRPVVPELGGSTGHSRGATAGPQRPVLGLNGPFDGRPEIYMLQGTEQDKAVVTATITNLGDDSVDAERYRVVFTLGRGSRYLFASGERTLKCQSGRGHQDFDVTTCS